MMDLFHKYFCLRRIMTLVKVVNGGRRPPESEGLKQTKLICEHSYIRLPCGWSLSFKP
jgi:hypothetical protein